MGNASACAPTSSIILSPVSLLMPPYVVPSLSLPLPISLHFFLSSSFPFFLLLALFLHLCLFALTLFFYLHLVPLPILSLFSSASLSSHPTESHPSSLGRHMCCFDSKGSDGARGRKTATPWQQRHIIVGKTHPIINYWSPSNSSNTLHISYCHCRLAQSSAIAGEVFNQSTELILY